MEARIKIDLECTITMLASKKDKKITFLKERVLNGRSNTPQAMAVGIKDKASSAGNFPQLSAKAGIVQPKTVINPLARAPATFFDKT